MHPRGQGLAGPIPVETDDAILAYPNNSGVPLVGCRVNAALTAKDLVAYPARVMPCRVDGLAGLAHDIRELCLAIEARGPSDFCAGQYAEIEFAPRLSRYYSMARTPAEEKPAFRPRCAIAGKSSSFVAQELKLGDKVKLFGPSGSSWIAGGRCLLGAHAGAFRFF